MCLYKLLLLLPYTLYYRSSHEPLPPPPHTHTHTHTQDHTAMAMRKCEKYILRPYRACLRLVSDSIDSKVSLSCVCYTVSVHYWGTVLIVKWAWAVYILHFRVSRLLTTHPRVTMTMTKYGIKYLEYVTVDLRTLPLVPRWQRPLYPCLEPWPPTLAAAVLTMRVTVPPKRGRGLLPWKQRQWPTWRAFIVKCRKVC